MQHTREAQEKDATASRKALLTAARVVGLDGGEAAELVKAASGPPQAAIEAAKALVKVDPVVT